MKSILTTLSLLLFVSISSAQSSCEFTIQGGVDTWPWNVAQPFPWTTIDGIWKLNSDSSNTYFRIRVTNSNNSRKILAVEKIAAGNCAKPVATGVGFMNSSEKNVVRMIMSDKSSRYQLTLAMFDTKVLADNGISLCGDQVLIANMQPIGQAARQSRRDAKAQQMKDQLMMLKKIPGPVDSICKKPAAH